MVSFPTTFWRMCLSGEFWSGLQIPSLGHERLTFIFKHVQYWHLKIPRDKLQKGAKIAASPAENLQMVPISHQRLWKNGRSIESHKPLESYCVSTRSPTHCSHYYYRWSLSSSSSSSSSSFHSCFWTTTRNELEVGFCSNLKDGNEKTWFSCPRIFIKLWST